MDRGQLSREEKIQSLIDAGYTRDGAIYFLDNGDVDRNAQATSQYSPYDLGRVGSMYDGMEFTGFPDSNQDRVNNPIPDSLVEPPKKGWAYEPEEGEEDPNKKQGLGEIPLIYGGGTSSEYEAYSLGNFLGMDKGTKGRGLGIAGSAGALGLGLLRQGFSGFANQKQNERSKNWATDKMNERNYKNNPQYRDRNYTGHKMGGTITLKPKSKN